MESQETGPQFWLEKFIWESNKIENIIGVSLTDKAAHKALLALDVIRVPDLEMFVHTITRDHVLRDKVGLDVQVGNYIPPAGGSDIRTNLHALLFTLDARSPFETHLQYEALHPFTDGNGRSGRALWLWQMLQKGGTSATQARGLGFLQTFYYSVLAQGNG